MIQIIELTSKHIFGFEEHVPGFESTENPFFVRMKDHSESLSFFMGLDGSWSSEGTVSTNETLPMFENIVNLNPVLDADGGSVSMSKNN
jgi:hypothetical protein